MPQNCKNVHCLPAPMRAITAAYLVLCGLNVTCAAYCVSASRAYAAAMLKLVRRNDYAAIVGVLAGTQPLVARKPPAARGAPVLADAWDHASAEERLTLLRTRVEGLLAALDAAAAPSAPPAMRTNGKTEQPDLFN